MRDGVLIFYGALLVTFGIFGNSLILLVLGRPSIQKPPAIILMIALAADLAACSTIGPFQLANSFFSSLSSQQNYSDSEASVHSQSHTRTIFCKFMIGFIYFVQFFIILLHALIAINRYCIVCQGTTGKMSRRQTLAFLLGLLFSSLIFGLACFLTVSIPSTQSKYLCNLLNLKGSQPVMVVFITTLLGTITTITILNTKMILHVRRQQNQTSDFVNRLQNSQRSTQMTADTTPTISLPIQGEINIASSSNTQLMTTCLQNKDVPVCVRGDTIALSEIRSHDHNNPSQPSSVCNNIMDLSPTTTTFNNGRASLHAVSISSINNANAPTATSANEHFNAPLSQQQQEVGIVPACHQQPHFHERTLSHMTKTLTVTTTIFVLLMLLTIATYFVPTKFKQSSHQIDLFSIFLMLMVGIAFLNHIINPLIYGFLSTKFRMELKRLFDIE